MDGLDEEPAVEEPADDDDAAALAAVDPVLEPGSADDVDVSEDDPDSPADAVEAVSPPDALAEDSPEETVSPAEALSPPEPVPSLPGPADPKEPPEEAVTVVFRIVRLWSAFCTVGSAAISWAALRFGIGAGRMVPMLPMIVVLASI